MNPLVIETLPELHDLVGQEVGVSDWVEITQARIDTFARATGDHQWIHVDPERAAKESPYGRTIAHGYLTLSLLPAFAAQILTYACGSARLNYGLNYARFPAPVPVGSRLRARVTIESAVPVPRGTQVRTTYHVEIEDDAEGRPACVATQITLILD